MSREQMIYGIHAVKTVLTHTPQRLQQLLLQKGRDDKIIDELRALAKQHGCSITERSRQDMDKLVIDANHQGVIAYCEPQQNWSEADIPQLLADLQEPAFILILDGVQDPHNLGACLRTANAAGVHFVIAPKDKSVGLTATVAKVACGAAEITPFIQVTNLARCLRQLKDAGVWLYGADGEAEKTLQQMPLTGAIALVLGGEGKGIRRLTRDLCDDIMAIPMFGTVESLNVSVATGICLYEAVRQRRG